ncbi:MAG: hypothetical protein M1483_04100 [Actinobacteria bacterium]|nr:hypothetical protein [Actinomycetota bacterium]MCL6104801.1 hypothetical protein [Actinomycetota bacterium]
MEINKELFEAIFPAGVYEWFEITKVTRDESSTTITFEEKDISPLEASNQGQKIIARKFHNITVTDFPLRHDN